MKGFMILLISLCIIYSAMALDASNIMDKLIYVGSEGKMVINVNNSVIAVSSNNIQFDFKSDCGNVVKYKLYVNGTCGQMTPIYIDNITCSKVPDNKSGMMDECINSPYIKEYVNKTYSCFVPFNNLKTGISQVLIDASEGLRFGKCEGSFGYKIDAVPKINILGVNYSRPDWAWWNVTCNNRVQINKTGYSDLNRWRATYINMTSTNFNFTKIANASGIYLTDNDGNMLPFKVWKFNKTSRTAELWWNISNYNTTKQIFYAYYNCSGLSDSQNPGKTFNWWYDFENGTSPVADWTVESGNFVNSSTQFVYDGSYSGLRGTNDSNYNAGCSPSFNPGDNYSVDFAMFVNATGSGLGMCIHNTTTYCNALSYEHVFNVGYDGSSYHGSFPWDAIVVNNGTNTLIEDSKGYVGGKWVRWRLDILLQPGSTIKTDMDTNMDNFNGSGMYFFNKTGSKGNFNVSQGVRYCLAQWNNYLGARQYLDNFMVYPFVNFTLETNSLGSEESSITNTCSCPSGANWKINLTDNCNMTANCNILGYNVSLEDGTTGNYFNMSTFTLIATYANFSNAGSGAQLIGNNGGYLNCSS